MSIQNCSLSPSSSFLVHCLTDVKVGAIVAVALVCLGSLAVLFYRSDFFSSKYLKPLKCVILVVFLTMMLLVFIKIFSREQVSIKTGSLEPGKPIDTGLTGESGKSIDDWYPILCPRLA